MFITPCRAYMSLADLTRRYVLVLVYTERVAGAREHPPGRQDIIQAGNEKVIRRFVAVHD